MAEAHPNLVLCVEDALYRRYLEEELAEAGVAFTAVAADALAPAIAENPAGLLVLQGEEGEGLLIDLAARLKRLVGDAVRILLLSADHRTADETGAAVDAFLQYPAPAAEVRRVLAALQDQTRRVLLIDDSRLVHNHLAAPLREQGYQVHQAYDGAEGVALARTHKPHLIICDIEMPGLNGYEVCAALRGTPELADAHIIMSSTHGSAADQQRGFEAGVDEYIQKPVVVAELLARIRKVFNRAPGLRELVLVVEAEAQVARAVTKLLGKQGFAVRAAGSLREARRLLPRTAFDLGPVAAQFVARPIDWVRVKGKTKPVACYEVFGEAGRVPPSEERLAAAFAQAMAAYREGRFAEALDQFQATEPLEATASPGAVNPSRLYQGRCRQLLAYLPAAWDGVWTLGTK